MSFSVLVMSADSLISLGSVLGSHSLAKEETAASAGLRGDGCRIRADDDLAQSIIIRNQRELEQIAFMKARHDMLVPVYAMCVEHYLRPPDRYDE